MQAVWLARALGVSCGRRIIFGLSVEYAGRLSGGGADAGGQAGTTGDFKGNNGVYAAVLRQLQSGVFDWRCVAGAVAHRRGGAFAVCGAGIGGADDCVCERIGPKGLRVPEASESRERKWFGGVCSVGRAGF